MALEENFVTKRCKFNDPQKAPKRDNTPRNSTNIVSGVDVIPKVNAHNVSAVDVIPTVNTDNVSAVDVKPTVNTHNGTVDTQDLPEVVDSLVSGVVDYERHAASTAIYKNVSVPRNMSYLFCGVVEEFCEFKSVIEHLECYFSKEFRVGGKWVSLGIPADPIKRDSACVACRLNSLKELGDVVWYLTAMCKELRVKLDSVVQIRNRSSTANDRENTISVSNAVSSMVNSIGTIGGKIKKAIRDDNEIMREEKQEVITDNIRDIFTCISRDLCPWLGSDILYVMQLNVSKIKSRFERGVINGDGDDR